MSSIENIQQAILNLSKSDYIQLRRWLSELDWEEWDQQIEADSADGKLDFLIAEEARRPNSEAPGNSLVHRTTPGFWSHFDSLPEHIQRTARRSFERLKENPRYASLRFKKVGKFWSVRVGLSHRAIAVEDGDDFIWVWIGIHAEYDRITGT